MAVYNMIVRGDSMRPTFVDGELITIHPPLGDDFEIGDVVIVNDEYVKRIVAIGPCHLQMINGRLIIDGEPVQISASLYERDYRVLRPVILGCDYDVTLGADEYWVLGDNRPESDDSRKWGAIKKQDITGIVL